jgi:hypothetical protein
MPNRTTLFLVQPRSSEVRLRPQTKSLMNLLMAPTTLWRWLPRNERTTNTSRKPSARTGASILLAISFWSAMVSTPFRLKEGRSKLSVIRANPSTGLRTPIGFENTSRIRLNGHGVNYDMPDHATSDLTHSCGSSGDSGCL